MSEAASHVCSGLRLPLHSCDRYHECLARLCELDPVDWNFWFAFFILPISLGIVGFAAPYVLGWNEHPKD